MSHTDRFPWQSSFPCCGSCCVCLTPRGFLQLFADIAAIGKWLTCKASSSSPKEKRRKHHRSILWCGRGLRCPLPKTDAISAGGEAYVSSTLLHGTQLVSQERGGGLTPRTWRINCDLLPNQLAEAPSLNRLLSTAQTASPHAVPAL